MPPAQRLPAQRRAPLLEWWREGVSTSRLGSGRQIGHAAAPYGLTDEELDFIVSYDIKHRMGRDARDKPADDGNK